MRTIKASEVVKGMRVRWETAEGSATVTTEGVLTDVGGETSAWLWIDHLGAKLHPDHPVTVLAEPEPEWVEGAWYRVEINGNKTHARRVEGGWVRWDGVAYPSWEDIDRSRVVTVLGRVLIVDWPGDEHASKLVETYGAGLTWDDFECSPLQKVADAIRTQGGAR